MEKKEDFFGFNSKKYFAAFFLLCFLALFRFFPIPINADDFGYQWVYGQISNFSPETVRFLFEANVLARPLALAFYLPIVALFNSNPLLLLLGTHLLSVAILLAMLFFNFKIFSTNFSKRAAFLSSFLLASSYLTTYMIGYAGSMNIALSAALLLAIIYFISIKESKKTKGAVFFLTLIALFVRETIAISIGLIFIALALNEILKAKSFSKTFFLAFAKKFVFLFFPFFLFWIYLKFVFGGIGPFQSSLMQHDFLNALVSFFSTQGAGIYYYFSYFSSYFLLPFFAFALALCVPNIFIFVKKVIATKFPVSRKGISVFFEKHFFSILLSSAFLGIFITLILSAHQAFRYMFPILPIVFGFFSKLFDDTILSKLKKQDLKIFFILLLANLAFWILFFNSNLLVLLFGVFGLTYFLNALFLLIALACFLPVFFALKNSKKLSGFLPACFFSVFLLLLSFSSIVQLNEVYSSFFVVHFGNSTIASQANAFIAKELPNDSRIFTLQGLSWIWIGSLGAFGRNDLQFFQRMPETAELKKGDYLIYNSIDGGLGILSFVEANNSKFKQVAVFGNSQNPFPRSNLGVYLLVQKHLLFEFFFPRYSEIRIYSFVG